MSLQLTNRKNKKFFSSPLSFKRESQTCHRLRKYLELNLTVKKNNFFSYRSESINNDGVALGVSTVFCWFCLFFQAGAALENLTEVEGKSSAIIR